MASTIGPSALFLSTGTALSATCRTPTSFSLTASGFMGSPKHQCRMQALTSLKPNLARNPLMPVNRGFISKIQKPSSVSRP